MALLSHPEEVPSISSFHSLAVARVGIRKRRHFFIDPMELWTSTQKTILAAALGTLDVPVRIERSLDERTGKARCDFHLGDVSADGKLNAHSIKTHYENGQLLRDLPEHPVLDIIFAKQNRDRLLDAVNRGERIQFVRQSGTQRTFYRTGGDCSFPGLEGQKSQFRTGDLNLTSALCRFGVPVLHVEGPRGQRRFYFDALARLTTGETLGEFCQAWREKRTDKEHPISYPIIGLANYARLVRAADGETEQILIRKPNSTKSAIIDPNTTGAGMDKTRRFFNG